MGDQMREILCRTQTQVESLQQQIVRLEHRLATAEQKYKSMCDRCEAMNEQIRDLRDRVDA